MFPINISPRRRANNVKSQAKTDPLSLPQTVGKLQIHLPVPTSVCYLILVFWIQMNCDVLNSTGAAEISPKNLIKPASQDFELSVCLDVPRSPFNILYGCCYGNALYQEFRTGDITSVRNSESESRNNYE